MRRKRIKGGKEGARREKGEQGGEERAGDAHLEYCGVLESEDRKNILVDEQAKNEDDDEDRGSANIHSNSSIEPLKSLLN